MLCYFQQAVSDGVYLFRQVETPSTTILFSARAEPPVLHLVVKCCHLKE